MDAGLKALRRVREDYPDAFLAGGYLRDLVACLEPKDIDIFTFQPPLRDEIPVAESVEYPKDRIVGVSSRVGFEYPVQVIHLKPEMATTPEQVVSQFALGIQQIYYVNEVCALLPFAKDMHGKTFTVTYCESDGEAWKIGRKLFHLKNKFPGFSLVIPTEFSMFEKTLVAFMTWENGEAPLEAAP